MNEPMPLKLARCACYASEHAITVSSPSGRAVRLDLEAIAAFSTRADWDLLDKLFDRIMSQMQQACDWDAEQLEMLQALKQDSNKRFISDLPEYAVYIAAYRKRFDYLGRVYMDLTLEEMQAVKRNTQLP